MEAAGLTAQMSAEFTLVKKKNAKIRGRAKCWEEFRVPGSLYDKAGEFSLGVIIGGAMTDGINEIAPDDMPNRRLLKAAEVAAYLGVSAKTVYRWCDMGLMESVKLNRSVRVLRASVVDFLCCGKNAGLG
jgi:excisionase family DNA binding protein